MPVVNAPFRLYWAYNPSIFRGYLQPPIAADRSYFPNNATYQNAIAIGGPADSVLRDGVRPSASRLVGLSKACRTFSAAAANYIWIEYNDFKG